MGDPVDALCLQPLEVALILRPDHHRGVIDVKPRPCANPAYAGKAFGSTAAAWWGFHYKELISEPKPREVITIFEIDATGQRNWAKAIYNFQWTPQTDPFGVVHKTIDYPGVPVDRSTVKENHGILKNVRIPIRPHFGVIGLARQYAAIQINYAIVGFGFFSQMAYGLGHPFDQRPIHQEQCLLRHERVLARRRMYIGTYEIER